MDYESRRIKSQKIKYKFITASNLTEIRETLSSSQTKVTKFTYDGAGNLTSITDADNRSRSFAYDDFGNLTEEKDGYGDVTERRTYDELFRLKSVSDGLSRTVNYNYSDLDQLTQIQTVFGTVEFSYDAKGNLNVVKDARLNETTFTYDPTTGDLLQVIDPEGGVSRYTYDAFGRLDSITDPNGEITIFDYDELGRLVYVGADYVLPTIKNQSVVNNSDGSVTITITASEKITDQTFFVREKGQAEFTEIPVLELSANQFKVTLTDLKADTDYEYSIRLVDRGKNEMTYGPYVVDRTGPIVTTNEIRSVRALSARFDFTANETIAKATLKIVKTSDESERQIVYDNLNLTTYTAEVGGLTASMGYEYSWELIDASGNKTLTPKVAFTTTATDSSFFIENTFLGANTSTGWLSLRVKFSKKAASGSLFYYREVGATKSLSSL